MNDFLGVEPTIALASPLMWGIVIAALLAAFFVTRRRPAYGLAAVIAALPLYQARGTVGLPTTFLELLLGAVVLAIITRWRDYPLGRTGYEPWLGLWVGGALLAALAGPDLKEGIGLWRAFFLEPAVFLIIAAAVFRKERRDPILWGAIGSILVIAAWTAYQLISGGDASYDHRLLGPYQSPNFLAMALVPLLLLIGFWPDRRGWVVRGPVVILGLVMLLASQSRGGFLALCAGLVVAFAYYARRLPAAVTGAIAATFVIVAVSAGVIIFNRPQPIIPVRRILWERSVDFIKHDPLFGAHPGQFQKRLAEHYRGNDFYTYYFVPFAPNSHDLWLVTWVEWGLLALVGLVGIVVTFIRKVVRLKRPEVLVPATMMAAILAHGLVDTAVLKNDLAIIFMLALLTTVIPWRRRSA